MLILLSPSKSQDFIHEAPTSIGIAPPFLRESKSVAKSLKKYSANELVKLMKISDKLAQFTHTRTEEWNELFKTQKVKKDGEYNFKQALFAYTGDVYKAFESGTYTKADYSYMEKNIRILSGLYGITTPLTYIKPYRLEMGTSLPIQKRKKIFKNLYQFWDEVLTKYVSDEFKIDELIINLASLEYSKAMKLNQYGKRVITISFKIKKQGKLKTIGIIAKRERGEMAYWLMKNNITHVADIKKYSHDNFVYSNKYSTSQEYVFVRGI